MRSAASSPLSSVLLLVLMLGLPLGAQAGDRTNLPLKSWGGFSLYQDAVYAFGVSRLLPKVYESTNTLVVPKERTGSGLTGLAASGLLQQLPGLSIPSLPSFTPNRDLLVGVLKSRTLAQGIVERFGLRDRYAARYVDDAITTLHAATTIAVSREGIISLKIEDRHPAQGAAMVNHHIELLDQFVSQYGTGGAGRQRTFLTRQLAWAGADLDTEEQALRRFQEHNRAIDRAAPAERCVLAAIVGLVSGPFWPLPSRLDRRVGA